MKQPEASLSVMSKDKPLRSSSGSAAGAPPVFMFGMERSGTTLLSMIVGAHPAMAVPLATGGMWYEVAETLDTRYNDLTRDSDLFRLIDDLLSHERVRLWDVEFNREQILAQLTGSDFPAVFEAFHRAYARSKNKPRWANMDIATLDHMQVANDWFSNALFVHIVRDGRDVALSHQTMPYGAGNIADCAVAWVHRLTVNIRMGQILGPDRYLLLRYEDLITRSQATLERLCDFLDLEYSPSMLAYNDMVDEKIPKNKRWLWPSIALAPDPTKVNRWHREMSEGQRIVFEGTANSLLKELSYEAYGQVPKRARAYGLEFWYFLGRGGRLGRLAAKMGVKPRSRLEREASSRRRDKILGNADSRQNSNATRQRDVFDSLVDAGVYADDLQHPPMLQSFFEEVIREFTAAASCSAPFRVLECGCGTGAWLSVLDSLLPSDQAVRLMGFDLSERMVQVARSKLKGRLGSDAIWVGDVLDPKSFDPANGTRGLDLIIAYDVIQQLPSGSQMLACELISRNLAPGGSAVIFDHERRSSYGWLMGLKKLLTRYLGLQLLPLYYCNAKYPSLIRISRTFARMSAFESRVIHSGKVPKRALVITRRAEWQ